MGDGKGKKGQSPAKPRLSKEQLEKLISEDTEKLGNVPLGISHFRNLHSQYDLSDAALRSCGGWHDLKERGEKLYADRKMQQSPPAPVDDSRYQPTAPVQPDHMQPAVPDGLSSIIAQEQSSTAEPTVISGEIPEEPPAPARRGDTLGYAVVSDHLPEGTDLEDVRRKVEENGGVFVEPKPIIPVSPFASKEAEDAYVRQSLASIGVKTTTPGMPAQVAAAPVIDVPVPEARDFERETTNVYEPGFNPKDLDAKVAGSAEDGILRPSTTVDEPVAAPGEVLGEEEAQDEELRLSPHKSTIAGMPIPPQIKAIDTQKPAELQESKPATSGTTLPYMAPVVRETETTKVDEPVHETTTPVVSLAPKTTLSGFQTARPEIEPDQIPSDDGKTTRISMEEMAAQADGLHPHSDRETRGAELEFRQQENTSEFFQARHLFGIATNGKHKAPAPEPEADKEKYRAPVVRTAAEEAAEKARVAKYITPKRESASVMRGLAEVRELAKDEHVSVDEATRRAKAAFAATEAAIPTVSAPEARLTPLTPQDEQKAIAPIPIVPTPATRTAYVPKFSPAYTVKKAEEIADAVEKAAEVAAQKPAPSIPTPAPAPVVDIYAHIEQKKNEQTKAAQEGTERARKLREEADRAEADAARSQEKAAGYEEIQKKGINWSALKKIGVSAAISAVAIAGVYYIISPLMRGDDSKRSSAEHNKPAAAVMAQDAGTRSIDATVEKAYAAVRKADAAIKPVPVSAAPVTPAVSVPPTYTPATKAPAVAVAPAVETPKPTVAPKVETPKPIVVAAKVEPKPAPVKVATPDTADTSTGDSCRDAAYKQIVGKNKNPTQQTIINIAYYRGNKGLGETDPLVRGKNATNYLHERGVSINYAFKHRAEPFAHVHVNSAAVSGKVVAECGGKATKPATKYVAQTSPKKEGKSGKISKASSGTGVCGLEGRLLVKWDLPSETSATTVNKNFITPNAEEFIAQFVKTMNEYKLGVLNIGGTASMPGGDAYNTSLSLRRAHLPAGIAESENLKLAEQAAKGAKQISVRTAGYGRTQSLGASNDENQDVLLSTGRIVNPNSDPSTAKRFKGYKPGKIYKIPCTGASNDNTQGSIESYSPREQLAIYDAYRDLKFNGKLTEESLRNAAELQGIKGLTIATAEDVYVEYSTRDTTAGELVKVEEIGRLSNDGQAKAYDASDTAESIIADLRDDIDRNPTNDEYKSDSLCIEETVASCMDGAELIKAQDAAETFSVDKFAGNFTYNDKLADEAEQIVTDLVDEVNSDPVNEKYMVSGLLAHQWETGEMAGPSGLSAPDTAYTSVVDALRSEIDNDPKNAKYQEVSTQELVDSVVFDCYALSDSIKHEKDAAEEYLPLNTALLSAEAEDSIGLNPDLRSELALMSFYNDVEAAYPGQKTPEPQDVQLKRAA